MVDAARTLRQLLLAPAAFFEDRPPAETLPIAAGLVVLLAVCLTGGILLLGSMLGGAIDATVTMDNPDRPPEPFCDQQSGASDSPVDENCDEPATIERDAGELVEEAVRDYLWIGLVVPFVMWFFGGAVLYGVGRLAGGAPSFGGTLALAGWAALPELVRLAVGLAGLRIALANVTITDVERGADALRAAMGPIEPLLALASLLTVAWQWHLLTGGLTREAGISRGAAGVGVGVPLGIFALLSVL